MKSKWKYLAQKLVHCKHPNITIYCHECRGNNISFFNFVTLFLMGHFFLSYLASQLLARISLSPLFYEAFPNPNRWERGRSKWGWSLEQKWHHVCMTLLCGSGALEHFLHGIEVTCYHVRPSLFPTPHTHSHRFGGLETCLICRSQSKTTHKTWLSVMLLCSGLIPSPTVPEVVCKM